MAIEPISLVATDDINVLRKSVEEALTRLAIRVDDGRMNKDLDLTDHRIKNVSYPVDDHDAVNVAYLRDQSQGGGTLSRRQQWRLQVNASGSGTATATSPPEWVKVETTMTTGTTTVGSLFSPSAGKYYAIVLYQDGTGNRLVDWGTASAFKGMAGWQPETTANTFSSFLFYCKASNNFQLLAPPVTGVS